MEDFSDLVRERRSIRAFLPDPVPAPLIREIISDACWAPSLGNTQSTFVYVLSGRPLEELKAGLMDRAVRGAMGNPDIEMSPPPSWPEPYRSRMSALIQSRAAYLAEQRSADADPSSPPEPPLVAGARLFGAPHLLLVCAPKGMPVPYSCFDAGLFAQTLALAARAQGLGTCVMTGVVMNADLLRAFIPGSDELLFVAAMALGRDDPNSPVNRVPRQRVEVEERSSFIGSD